MAGSGWIPVDALTLETSYCDVYAIGDVTSTGTPEVGVVAEGRTAVVAEAIIATLVGQRTSTRRDGHGQCYLEHGDDQVARVDVVSMSGQVPTRTSRRPPWRLATRRVG
jgi:sulfide:quinone oxidoreductase